MSDKAPSPSSTVLSPSCDFTGPDLSDLPAPTERLPPCLGSIEGQTSYCDASGCDARNRTSWQR
jgi:hypothetical protein